MPDFVDNVAARWSEQRPELDVSSIEVLDRVLRISQLMVRRSEAVCEQHGITFWGFAVLTALRRAGPPYQLTPTSLYRSAMVSSGAVTKRVSELERHGLVERVPDPDDGRSMLVRLTTRGRRVVDATVPAYLEMQRETLAWLDTEQHTQFAALLRSLLQRLEPPMSPDRSVDPPPAGADRRGQ
jgi:DNA-binding MarR family transcriptional regulator